MHSTATVAEWLDRIFESEGGFQRDRLDPGNWTGGAVDAGVLKGTKYGISAAAYPNLDIMALTLDEAADLYIADYLGPIQANRFADGVAFQLLDFAVHSGPREAKRQLQQALGVVADGVIGPVTLAAIHDRTEAQVCLLLIGERLDFMTDLPNWAHNSRGWAKRIARKLKYAAQDCAEAV